MSYTICLFQRSPIIYCAWHDRTRKLGRQLSSARQAICRGAPHLTPEHED
jgi:hypothetical protein